MIDLSFYRRTDMLLDPIIVKDAAAINRPLPWMTIKVIGAAICIVCLAINVPAGAVVGGAVAWYASGRGRA